MRRARQGTTALKYYDNMNFKVFWKWLLKRHRVIKNLGGQIKSVKPRIFCIEADKDGGICIPQATGKKHPFSKKTAKKVWERYLALLALNADEHLIPGRYVNGKKSHNWNPCPQPPCCNPWIAAAIRDFSKSS